MAQHQCFSHTRLGGDIQIWKHGKPPIPIWLKQHMTGDIAKNGTFILKTGVGRVRVNAGDVVIEKRGELWVRTTEEAPGFIKDLKTDSPLPITSIGPGKARQFGTAAGTKEKSKKRRISKTRDRRPHYPDPVGAFPSIGWAHLETLSIDGTYQRSTDNEASRRLIAHIAFHFDWRLCNPLVVSRRPDGRLMIIDGQHRWLAAQRRTDIPQLPCCIFTYESIQEEARMFILANRSRKPMNRLDDFYAALAAGDEDALEIQQMVVDAGLRVTRSTAVRALRAGEIAFTSSIARAIRSVGPAITSAALTDMAVGFQGQKLGHGGAIFGALIKILSAPQPGFDPDRLVCTLQTRTVDQWGGPVTGLRGGDTRATAIQKAIMEAYREQAVSTAA